MLLLAAALAAVAGLAAMPDFAATGLVVMPGLAAPLVFVVPLEEVVPAFVPDAPVFAPDGFCEDGPAVAIKQNSLRRVTGAIAIGNYQTNSRQKLSAN